MQCKHGPSPDEPTVLLATASGCPLFVTRQVQVECELFQAVFEKAPQILTLEEGKQLVYRGESAGQVAERLRLEISGHLRHKWTDTEKRQYWLDKTTNASAEPN